MLQNSVMEGFERPASFTGVHKKSKTCFNNTIFLCFGEIFGFYKPFRDYLKRVIKLLI